MELNTQATPQHNFQIADGKLTVTITGNRIDGTGNTTSEPRSVTLNHEQLSDIVNHAIQLSVVMLNRDNISSCDADVVESEFLNALNAAGAINIENMLENDFSDNY